MKNYIGFTHYMLMVSGKANCCKFYDHVGFTLMQFASTKNSLGNSWDCLPAFKKMGF